MKEKRKKEKEKERKRGCRAKKPRGKVAVCNRNLRQSKGRGSEYVRLKPPEMTEWVRKGARWVAQEIGDLK